jgi:hypothetical protein
VKSEGTSQMIDSSQKDKGQGPREENKMFSKRLMIIRIENQGCEELRNENGEVMDDGQLTCDKGEDQSEVSTWNFGVDEGQ